MDLKTKHVFHSLTALGLFSGCGRPNLPTKPPFHLALTARVEIGGNDYPLDFTWSEENYVAWNEGVGWHTEWKSSHRTFAKFAVAAWLPAVHDADVATFQPSFALIDRANPRFVRLYPTPKIGEKRDGFFQLTQLKIERSPKAVAVKPMASDEESLNADIVDRKYGNTSRKYSYLYGRRFHKEQWSRSQDLQRLLSPLKGLTPLGKLSVEAPGKRPEAEATPVKRAFINFTMNIASKEKMDEHLFGFEFRGDARAWTPLSHPGVYWCREGLEDESAPIRVSYRDHLIDQREHELLFDETTQQLVSIQRIRLGFFERR
jgi:hypothetical protein